MIRPPAGLCLPCNVHRVRDGDTVEVKVLGGGYVWAIRLIDCWAPETSTEAGKKAKQFVEEVLADIEAGAGLHVWIPAPANVKNLLKNLTFDRVPGHLFLSTDRTLSEMIVSAGLATQSKT